MESRTRGNTQNSDLTMDVFIQIPNKLLLMSSAIESLSLNIVKTIKEEGEMTRKTAHRILRSPLLK